MVQSRFSLEFDQDDGKLIVVNYNYKAVIIIRLRLFLFFLVVDGSRFLYPERI